MSMIFNLFKNLRRYFFLKIVVWLSVMVIIYQYNLFGLFSHSPISDIDDFYYFDYLDDLFFSFIIFIAVSFLLFPFEAFFRFLIRKFILKKDIKPIPKHENKVLNVLDNIYTLFFILILISAILYFYFSFFG